MHLRSVLPLLLQACGLSSGLPPFSDSQDSHTIGILTLGQAHNHRDLIEHVGVDAPVLLGYASPYSLLATQRLQYEPPTRANITVAVGARSLTRRELRSIPDNAEHVPHECNEATQNVTRCLEFPSISKAELIDENPTPSRDCSSRLLARSDEIGWAAGKRVLKWSKRIAHFLEAALKSKYKEYPGVKVVKPPNPWKFWTWRLWKSKKWLDIFKPKDPKNDFLPWRDIRPPVREVASPFINNAFPLRPPDVSTTILREVRWDELTETYQQLLIAKELQAQGAKQFAENLLRETRFPSLQILGQPKTDFEAAFKIFYKSDSVDVAKRLLDQVKSLDDGLNFVFSQDSISTATKIAAKRMSHLGRWFGRAERAMADGQTMELALKYIMRDNGGVLPWRMPERLLPLKVFNNARPPGPQPVLPDDFLPPEHLDELRDVSPRPVSTTSEEIEPEAKPLEGPAEKPPVVLEEPRAPAIKYSRPKPQINGWTRPEYNVWSDLADRMYGRPRPGSDRYLGPDFKDSPGAADTPTKPVPERPVQAPVEMLPEQLPDSLPVGPHEIKAIHPPNGPPNVDGFVEDRPWNYGSGGLGTDTSTSALSADDMDSVGLGSLDETGTTDLLYPSWSSESEREIARRTWRRYGFRETTLRAIWRSFRANVLVKIFRYRPRLTPKLLRWLGGMQPLQPVRDWIMHLPDKLPPPKKPGPVDVGPTFVDSRGVKEWVDALDELKKNPDLFDRIKNPINTDMPTHPDMFKPGRNPVVDSLGYMPEEIDRVYVEDIRPEALRRWFSTAKWQDTPKTIRRYVFGLQLDYLGREAHDLDLRNYPEWWQNNGLEKSIPKAREILQKQMKETRRILKLFSRNIRVSSHRVAAIRMGELAESGNIHISGVRAWEEAERMLKAMLHGDHGMVLTRIIAPLGRDIRNRISDIPEKGPRSTTMDSRNALMVQTMAAAIVRGIATQGAHKTWTAGGA
ncbi:hypothetical protein ANO11243_087960 [Dothideomycetidae sp. 11243]|nr:hypothetical protein ANO11243_087960 [fungal sp. No.11243]